MASWTTPKDIKDRTLSGLQLPTDGQLQTFIDDVEIQIRRAYPQIQERINKEELELGIIVQNVSFWVIDYLQTGGKPYQQESQSYTGAASRSVTMFTGARTNLKLTPEDLAVFAPHSSGAEMIDFASTARVTGTPGGGIWHNVGWGW